MAKIDILIPNALESRYSKSVKPALEATGVTARKSLLEALGKPECASIWLLRIRRPKKGSKLFASDQGGNRKAGDAILIFFNGIPPQNNRLIKIDSVFGLFVSAQPVNGDEENEVDWEDHSLLVISTDFITMIADILPGNDAFVGVAVWMNSLLPLYIVAQKTLGSVSALSIGNYRILQDQDIMLKALCKKCGKTGTITCEKCDGAGKWQPNLPCNSCNGTGLLSCRPCSGNGVIQPEFNPLNGTFRFYDEEISAKHIQAYDVKNDLEYSLNQAAKAVLLRLTAEYNLRSAKKKAVEATQDEIAKIDHCLELAMEPQKKRLQNLGSIEMGRGEATTQRINKCTVRKFPVFKGFRKQIVDWESSVSVGQSLLLKNDDEDIALHHVNEDANLKLTPSFQGFEVENNTTYFFIGFPEGVDSGVLPEQFSVWPVPIPPAELKQQKELGRWCSHYSAPKLMEAISIVGSTFTPQKPAEIEALDPNIKNNQRQQEALNLIMSGAPLVLVKGPPGTGKTSLIKEVILQSILRGEKVLVCSETHTAVANVLERLEGDERIRMIRRGRPNDEKLKETEKKYLEESRQGYLQEKIHECTTERRYELKKLKTQLSKLPALLDAAYEAAKQLHEILRQLSRDEIKAEKDHLAKNEKIDKRKEESIALIETQRDQELASLIAQLRKLEKSLENCISSIEKQNRLKRNASDLFTQTTGKKPPRVKSEKSKWKLQEKIEAIIPNKIGPWIIPKRLLTERYNAALELLAEYKLKVEEVNSKILENQENQKKIKKTASNEITPIKIAAKDKHQTNEEEYSLIVESIKKDAAAAECKFLPAQKECSDYWNKITCLPLSGSEELPDGWLTHIEECKAMMSEVDGKIEFIDRWLIAAERDPGEITRFYLDTLNVFMSTCVGLASWKLFNDRFSKEGVDLVIIDEAAHATLTQSLIPLGRAKRAVLIGDEMQLPPAAPMDMESQCEKSCVGRCREPIMSGDIKNQFKPLMSPCWLERSAFEWIVETRPSIPVVMLNRQFRMHPDIADFVASIFYDKGLQNGVTAEERTLQFGDFQKAVCLISTSAYRDHRFETQQGLSYTNGLEVEMTRKILQQAREHLRETTSFGVITPYAAQRELMQLELGDFFGLEGHLNMGIQDIGSVDSFQGSEWDVMIASFVRSPRNRPTQCRACAGSGKFNEVECAQCYGRGWKGANLKWVHDLRRLNVAFSRARKMLILIGDVNALTNPAYGTAAGAEILTRFNAHVLDRGRVLRVWEQGNI